MSSPHPDCLRAARDMAELLWRNRASSALYGLLQTRLAQPANQDDQALLSALQAVLSTPDQAPVLYLHWVSASASNYVSAPPDSSILYVMQPERLASMQQAIAASLPHYRYSVEANHEIALLHVG